MPVYQPPPPLAPPSGTPGTDVPPGGNPLYFWLVLVIAAIARFWHLGARSLTTDEGTAWTIASAPLTDLLRMCAQEDASPPLFHALTSLPLLLGGTEFHVRLISALASIGVVWLTYRIARLFAGRHEAAFAAAIVAISPFQVMYGQEAGPSMLAAFWMVLAMFFFVRIALLHHTEKGLWAGYIAATALALYTHNVAVVGIVVQFLFVVLTAEGRAHALRWFGAVVAAFVFYAPWLMVTHQQTGLLVQSHWQLAQPDPHAHVQLLRAVFLTPISLITAPPGAPLPGLEAWMPRWLAWTLLTAIPLVPILMGARGLMEHSDRGRVIRVALASVVLPLSIVYLVSLLRPMGLPRDFVFLTPFLAIVAARGIGSMSPLLLRWAWISAWVVMFGYATVRYDTDFTKQPWRDAVAHVARQTEAVNITGMAQGVAVLVPFKADPFEFYNRRYQKGPTVFEMSHPQAAFAAVLTPEQIDEMEAAALEAVAEFEEVWVVTRVSGSAVRREVVSRAERIALTGREETERREWDSVAGSLSTVRFRRTSP